MSAEGELVKAWRAKTEMTQEAFGAACRTPQLSRSRVRDIESGRFSATVDTLLNIITAIEEHEGQRLGATDAERLARFFQGPSVERALDRFEDAARAVLGIRPGRKR